MKLFLILPALAVAGLTGCASIVDGSQQTMTFNSSPEGATVIFNGLPVGKTPVTVPVHRHSAGTVPVRFSKEGFKDYDAAANSRLNNWFWGNIITGGLLGSTTDNATGAMYEYDPGAYMVTLTPADTGTPNAISLAEKQKIINFIVAGYSSLSTELNGTPGQYVASLMELANVPKDARDEATHRLKAMATAYPVIPEFADKASDILVKKPESK
jgi:hypothetical protein